MPESTSGFAYVYNTNAIEIVTKGRIWPRALYCNFFFKADEKKLKTFCSEQKTFKQESALAKDMVIKWIFVREIQRMMESF